MKVIARRQNPDLVDVDVGGVVVVEAVETTTTASRRTSQP